MSFSNFKRFSCLLLIILSITIFPSLTARASETSPTFSFWPVQGEIINQFKLPANPYTSGGHRGIDIQAPTGTEVVAVGDGTVAFWSSNQGENGMMISIDHPNGLTTTYLHLSEIFSEAKGKGKSVIAGQSIGKVGTTGNPSSYVPHLHFGVFLTESRTKSSYEYIDPAQVLPAVTSTTSPSEDLATSPATELSPDRAEPTVAGGAESPLSPNPSVMDELPGTESPSLTIKPEPYGAVPTEQAVGEAGNPAPTAETYSPKAAPLAAGRQESAPTNVVVQPEPAAISPSASAPLNQEPVSQPPESVSSLPGQEQGSNTGSLRANTASLLAKLAPEKPRTIREVIGAELKIRPQNAVSFTEFSAGERTASRKDEMLWAALFILLLTFLIRHRNLPSKKLLNHWLFLHPAFSNPKFAVEKVL